MLDPDDEDPGAVGARLCALLQGLVEIIPVEEEVGLIGLGVPPPVDAAQYEAPLARIYGAAQRDHVPDLPAVLGRHALARERAFAVVQEILELLRRHDELRYGLRSPLASTANCGKKFFSLM